ncbi:alpha/beta hydrolase [Myxococcota bacterium]|nr:alpha/beta hydrolase [Myxococcota bacterium]
MSDAGRVTGALRALWSMAGPPGDVDAPTHAALAYAPLGEPGRRGRPPVADLYLPDGPGSHAGILWVHGGGFTVGSRAMKPMRLLATACRRAGFATMTFDYRLLFRGGDVDTGVEDTRAAWSFLVANAPRFGLDTRRLALGGLSAGGCLALLSAPTLAPAPAKLVSVFSLYDFETLTGGLGGLLARLAAGRDPDGRRARSPVNGPVVALDCPVLVQHGTADTLIPVDDARRFAAARRAAGRSVVLNVYDGAPHAFYNAPESETARRATADLLAFLRGA